MHPRLPFPLWLVALAMPAWGAEPEVVWVDTADGAWIAMEHHPNEGGPPVVLVHGISSNHRFWDLEDGRSLADALQARGYDVWNLDLRGHGHALRDPDGNRQRPGWTVDDYGTADLPAAFAYVREATGAERLHYVGHSMGGIVLAVYLATTPDPPIASAVAVGSPLDFRDPDPVTRTLLHQSWLGTVTGFTPTPAGARLLAGMGEKAPLAADEWLFNPDNIAPDARKRMLRAVVSPLSRGEVKQFGRTRRDGELRSMDGGTVYREALAEATVPMLFVAGRADRVATTDRVFAFYEAVGSPDKELVIASEANGFSADYGHLDLGVGDRAAEEVFPRIGDWLDRWR